jgi:acyl-coenzyme A thioesterase PaaI-like protein
MNAPADPQFASRVRESYGRQKAMALIGATLTAVDAAFSLMPADCSLVTVEYKLNILTPARRSLVARGQVVKPGRTLTVARAEVYADDGAHVASMQQTLMRLAGTPDTPE